MNALALAAIAAVVSTPSSSADGLTPPEHMPAVYRSECGSCHVPYPPNLLSAGGFFSAPGWRDVMGNLANHYGDNAAIDESARREIERYLIEHAGDSERRFGSRNDPPRLTATLWFRRNHGTMKPHFRDGPDHRPANCQACHPKAEDWQFARKDVKLPGAARRGAD